jgi:hypothetical protein
MAMICMPFKMSGASPTLEIGSGIKPPAAAGAEHVQLVPHCNRTNPLAD